MRERRVGETTEHEIANHKDGRQNGRNSSKFNIENTT